MEQQKFLEAARYLGASEMTARAAYANLKRGSLVLLAVNGWIAAGKDTVAPQVLEKLGVKERTHLYYALPLKDELDELISLVSTSKEVAEAIDRIQQSQQVTDSQAGFMTGLLWTPTRVEGHGLTARSRTKEIRTALQYWGTAVRREQDPDYWAKKALSLALEEMAAGRSVYFTDLRFQNEADLAQSIGFHLVRIEITREEQRRRLMERDGIEPDPAMIYHESETGLDEYQDFDLVVDNNQPTGAADEIVQNLQRS